MKLLKYIYLILAVYSYIQGGMNYTAEESVYAAGYALISAFFFLLFIGRFRKDRYYSMKLSKIDKMSGVEFEKYLAVQFRRKGYRVKITEKSHDYGADLILKKRRKTIIVQAKRYEKNIGIKAVQEIVGAIAYYEADEAMVVTNRYYTKSAIRLANQNGVELWNRDHLKSEFGAR